MTKKKKKISILGLVGVLLITSGVVMIGYKFVTDYLENKSISEELDDFFDRPFAEEGVIPEAVDGETMGVISIDSIDVNHLVMESANWDYLNRYVVAWPDKKLNEGNYAIAGHNGACSSCVFRDLDKLKDGETITITTKDKVYTYEVYDVFIVDYTDMSVLDDVEGKVTLTLVTCSVPMTYDQYRTIVKAELVSTVNR